MNYYEYLNDEANNLINQMNCFLRKEGLLPIDRPENKHFFSSENAFIKFVLAMKNDSTLTINNEDFNSFQQAIYSFLSSVSKDNQFYHDVLLKKAETLLLLGNTDSEKNSSGLDDDKVSDSADNNSAQTNLAKAHSFCDDIDSDKLHFFNVNDYETFVNELKKILPDSSEANWLVQPNRERRVSQATLFNQNQQNQLNSGSQEAVTGQQNLDGQNGALIRSSQ